MGIIFVPILKIRKPRLLTFRFPTQDLTRWLIETVEPRNQVPLPSHLSFTLEHIHLMRATFFIPNVSIT